jgi:hypothetical protein
MSKISLAPDASGTGIFTIASPNSDTNRTLTLPDDTGTIVTNSGNQAGSFTTLAASSTATFAAGAVGTPAITTTGDTNTGIFFPAADTIAFAEGGAEAMRIDSSGNVGIGTTNPTVKFQVEGTVPEVNFVSYSGANNYGVTHRFRTAKGSLASPTVVVSGGEILTLIGQGYNGSAFLLPHLLE